MADEFDRDAVATEVQKLKADLVRFVLTDVRDNPGRAGTPALSAEVAALVEGAVRKTLSDPQGEVARLKGELASAIAQVQHLRAGLESTSSAALSAARTPKGAAIRHRVDSLHANVAPEDSDVEEDGAGFSQMQGPSDRESNPAGLGKWSLPVGAGLVAGVMATLAAQYLMQAPAPSPAPVQMSVEQRIDNSANGYGDALDVLASALSAAGLGPDAPESVEVSAIETAKRDEITALLRDAADEADALKRALQPAVSGGDNRSITELATQADQWRAQASRLQAASEPMEPKKLNELAEQGQSTMRRLQSSDNR